MTEQSPVAKVGELVDRARLCMLTTMTADGKHVSRPMALQDTEFDGDLWFFADEGSDKAKQIAASPQVNVAFSNPKDGEWTSISGTAEVVHDRAKMEELYTKYLEVVVPRRPRDPGHRTAQGARGHRGVLGRRQQQGQADPRKHPRDPEQRPRQVPAPRTRPSSSSAPDPVGGWRAPVPLQP